MQQNDLLEWLSLYNSLNKTQATVSLVNIYDKDKPTY